MWKSLSKLLLIQFLTSCFSSGQLYEPSTLVVEGKKCNHLIVDRFPEYGEGRKDGCVVAGQISLNVTSYHKDTIRGVVIDSKTKSPLLFARIQIYPSNVDTSFSVRSDQHGIFCAPLQDWPTKIVISSIGYRNLQVNTEELNK